MTKEEAKTQSKMLATLANKYAGQTLKAARESREMSQETLAAGMGVSFQQVQKYEWGVNRMSAGAIVLACVALKVLPEIFFKMPDDHQVEVLINPTTKKALNEVKEHLAKAQAILQGGDNA